MKNTYLTGAWIILTTCALKAQVPFINPVCKAILASQTTALLCNSSPWVLVYSDDFNGTQLDPLKWETKTGVPYDYFFTKQKQWYQTENVRVNNGSMIIDIVREFLPNKTFTGWDPNIGSFQLTSDFNFSSGFVSSKYLFGYGQLEIRCNVPQKTGLFPASWLFGTDPSGIINNEIDNFEFIFDNGPVEHLMTQHYKGMYCPISYHAANKVNSPHTFTVIWSPYNIEWYVDGDLKRIDFRFSTQLSQPLMCSNVPLFTPVLKNEVFPKDPMFIYTNVAARHGHGNIPPDPNTWPTGNAVHMEVDHIRYYQRLPCSSNLHITTLTNFTNGNYAHPVYKTVLGSQVLMTGSCILAPPQKQLSVVARDLVKIMPDVHITYGTQFTARIDPLACPGVPIQGPPVDPVYNPDEDPESFQGRNDLPDRQINNLAVYPNPAQSEVHVKGADQEGPYYIIITDMLGHIVKEITVLSFSEPIPISNLPDGVYSCRISRAEKVIGTKKITIRN